MVVQKQGFKLGKRCSLRLKQLGFNRFAGFASCLLFWNFSLLKPTSMFVFTVTDISLRM